MLAMRDLDWSQRLSRYRSKINVLVQQDHSNTDVAATCCTTHVQRCMQSLGTIFSCVQEEDWLGEDPRSVGGSFVQLPHTRVFLVQVNAVRLDVWEGSAFWPTN